MLRMRPGDNIIVLDNSGIEWLVILTEVGPGSVRGQLVGQQPIQNEPTLHLTLYQATLKAQKFEWVLQKGTELGVGRFVPTICQRSVGRDVETLAKKRPRWQHIIREAAEQSGRGMLPQLAAAIPWVEAVRHASSNSLRLMLWPEATALTLKEVLAGVRTDMVALFIGPEGGFTAEEAALARQAGLELVRLGPRILRAETAGLAACSAIFYALGEWD